MIMFAYGIIFKVLMKRKIRYCDYGFIGKNF